MLITIEGIDGCGKTTLQKGLRIRLKDLHPLFTKEPTNSKLGQSLKNILSQSNADPLLEATLFIADHAAHVAEVIRPALFRKRIVICDRYIDSRIAYQQLSLQNTMENPNEFLKLAHEGWTVIPDLTLYIDINPETAVDRIKQREFSDHFETLENLKKIQENYKKIISENPKRFVVLNGNQPKEFILKEAEMEIRKRLR